MATKKLLYLICDIPNFGNAYVGKVTKFQGYSLFRKEFWAIYCLVAEKHPPPPPGMNSGKAFKIKLKIAFSFPDSQFVWEVQTGLRLLDLETETESQGFVDSIQDCVKASR